MVFVEGQGLVAGFARLEKDGSPSKKKEGRMPQLHKVPPLSKNQLCLSSLKVFSNRSFVFVKEIICCSVSIKEASIH